MFKVRFIFKWINFTVEMCTENCQVLLFNCENYSINLYFIWFLFRVVYIEYYPHIVTYYVVIVTRFKHLDKKVNK